MLMIKQKAACELKRADTDYSTSGYDYKTKLTHNKQNNLNKINYKKGIRI